MRTARARKRSPASRLTPRSPRSRPERRIGPMSTHADTHADPRAGESMVRPHGSTDDHGGDHGHDDHGHGGEALGPINTMAWGMAALGILLGLVVVVAFMQALS